MRSGHSSQGLARSESHAANRTAIATRILDCRRIGRPTQSRAKAPITKVSEVARPNLPVRSAWSAVSPTARTKATEAQVAVDLSLVPAQAGRTTETGRHAAPSQRQRPSGES